MKSPRIPQTNKLVRAPMTSTPMQGDRKFGMWRSVKIKELLPSDPQRLLLNTYPTTIILEKTQHTDRSRGECRFPRNILAINACQL